MHSAGSYAVYAKATDGGSPASGIATLTANVSTITSGQTAVALPTCTTSCTVGGVTYTYKSAPLTASSIADGSKSFSVTATDAAANSLTSSYTATADSTVPAVTAAVVVNTAPSYVGYTKPSATYAVYANAADTNMSTVTANVSNLTSGQTALALSTCASSCTQGGVTYAYKSTTQTAGAGIAQGATAFSVTATDKAANVTTGSYSVTVDSTAPTVSGVAIANTTTSAVGLLKKSGTYAVYANATDVTGIASVKANVGSITSGQTALSLSACASSCTVGGVTYAYKSASKTAGSTLAAGSVAYTVTATDGLSNTTTANGAVTVDNTAPTLSAETVATTATGVPGYMSQGHTYLVYANAADTNGIYSVSANVKNLTTGATAVAMPACASGVRRRCDHVRVQERDRDGQRQHHRGQQVLHHHRHRPGGQHRERLADGHDRQHRSDGRDLVPDRRLQRRLVGRLQHPGDGRHLRHGERRDQRPCERPGQPAPGDVAEHVLEPGRELCSRRRPRC